MIRKQNGDSGFIFLLVCIMVFSATFFIVYFVIDFKESLVQKNKTLEKDFMADCMAGGRKEYECQVMLANYTADIKKISGSLRGSREL